jgi:hypothetical protein
MVGTMSTGSACDPARLWSAGGVSHAGGGADAIPIDEFADLDLVPDTFKGRAVMMAGRIIGVEPDGQGVIIVAEWLPVPKDMGKGPSEVDVKPDRKFVVHYPKAIDSAGLWEGNKFVTNSRHPTTNRAFLPSECRCIMPAYLEDPGTLHHRNVGR